jgi:RNA polymerase sigma-70 factor (ECF subfamily)
MDQPELVWLTEYRDGNVEAMGKLVAYYRRPLFGFILRMTEGRGDAEEIFQEVWLRVIKSQHRYHHRNFKSWLFRIAHNLVIDRVRKQRPVVDLQASALEDGENVFETRVADTALPAADQLDARELGSRIAEAVRTLPPDQREVFLLRTEAQLPFKQIAGIQGTSINTALARMQYALAKLRTLLKTEYQQLQGDPT